MAWTQHFLPLLATDTPGTPALAKVLLCGPWTCGGTQEEAWFWDWAAITFLHSHHPPILKIHLWAQYSKERVTSSTHKADLYTADCARSQLIITLGPKSLFSGHLVLVKVVPARI